MTNKIVISSLLGAFLLLSACNGETIPEGDPKSTITGGMRGDQTPAGVLVGKSRSHYWVQQALSGWDASDSKAFPAEISKLKPLAGCSFTRPLENDLVRSVHFNAVQQPTSILRQTDKSKKPTDNTLGVIDVIITEKTNPVYLTLFTHSNAIWNFHVADGVKLARIVLVGTSELGVANVPTGTPVEVIAKSTFKRCKIPSMARNPMSHWEFVQNEFKIHKTKEITETIQNNIEFYWAFSNWHKKQFGQTMKDSIQSNQAAHALIGPLPDFNDRVKYNPIKGTQIKLTNLKGIKISSD